MEVEGGIWKSTWHATFDIQLDFKCYLWNNVYKAISLGADRFQFMVNSTEDN